MTASSRCVCFSSGKDGAFLSPTRAKESMDLYEELITEEREEKDATYNEVLILLRFNANANAVLVQADNESNLLSDFVAVEKQIRGGTKPSAGFAREVAADAN